MDDRELASLRAEISRLKAGLRKAVDWQSRFTITGGNGQGNQWAINQGSDLSQQQQQVSQATEDLTPFAPVIGTSDPTSFTLVEGRVRDFDLADMTVNDITASISCPNIGGAVWIEFAIDPSTSLITPTVRSGIMPDIFVFDSSSKQTEFNALLIEVGDATTDTRPGTSITVGGETRLLVHQFNRGIDLVMDVHSGQSVVSAKDTSLNYPSV